MILKIGWDGRQEVGRGETYVLVRVPFYAQYGQGAYLATTHGKTEADFDGADKALHTVTVFVGQRGGISIER